MNSVRTEPIGDHAMRLSRSYQPRTLDEVVGQPAVIRRLKRAGGFASALLSAVRGPRRRGQEAPRPRLSSKTWAFAHSPVLSSIPPAT